MKKTNKGPRPKFNYGKALYFLFLSSLAFGYAALPMFAAGNDMWTKASEIMKDVYSNVVVISTIAAVVTVAIALLLMNFSKNGRTVDESRAWLKRIIITWVILNGLGFIMAYLTPCSAEANGKDKV